MLHIDAKVTRDALPFTALIDALRAVFAAPCEVPARHVHAVGPAGGVGVTSLIMPAWNTRYYGVKIVNIAPGNSALGLQGLHAAYLLHDAATGIPLALIDGDAITTRRTAAASALAANWLAREDSGRLLVVGAGKVARLLPQAFSAVRPIGRVEVWARAPDRAKEAAAEWRALGIDAHAAADLEQAVREADIVSCATLATAPVVHGAWLHPGSHLDLIGSFTAAMRETDDACFAGASVYVDTEEALQKSGDLLGPMSRGVFDRAAVRGTLQALASGSCTGRSGPAERTVFKAVGSAMEDLAAAILVYETVQNVAHPQSSRTS